MVPSSSCFPDKFRAKASQQSFTSDPYVLELAETLQDSLPSSPSPEPPPLLAHHGIAAPNLTLVCIPEGCHVDIPIHLDYMHPPTTTTTTDAMQLSNPWVLVVVDKGAQANIIEEFSASQDNENDFYWSNAAFEAVIGEGAKLTHSYIQTQSFRSAHIKWTSIRQVNLLFMKFPLYLSSSACEILC